MSGYARSKKERASCTEVFLFILSRYLEAIPVSLREQLCELKNKGKVQLANTKSDRGPLRELFITKLKLQFKRGFTKVVVTRAGRLREWSQGELRLYPAKTQF